MTDILYISDLAKLLGTTEAAIRSKLQRKADLPDHYKLGSRVIWLKEDYDAWLNSKTTAVTLPNGKTKGKTNE